MDRSDRTISGSAGSVPPVSGLGMTGAGSRISVREEGEGSVGGVAGEGA